MTIDQLLPHANPTTGKPCVHLVGVSGSGMKALAEVLLDQNWNITGSDQTPDPATLTKLKHLGASIAIGHSAENLPASCDLLIHSPAIPVNNVERVAARERHIPELSYIDALSRTMRDRFGIAVAGTHGKSTTTGMLGEILKMAGQQPTVICGAERSNDQRSGYSGPGPHVVVEACEYRGHFLKLSPQILCITGIEPDHFDCFPVFSDAIAMYQQLVNQLPPGGILVSNKNCEVSEALKCPSHVKRITFDFRNPNADWSASDLNTKSLESVVEILRRGEIVAQLTLNQPGKHNACNALAATIIATECEVPLETTARALGDFQGLLRRYQSLPDRFGTKIIDDYAHHPTEIMSTLNTARSRFPEQRVICVFQPHQVSRTLALFEDFVRALSLADHVFILPVFGARETYQTELVETSEKLVAALQNMKVTAQLIPALDQVWRTLETVVLPEDLIFTLGAGDIARIHHERF